MLTTVLHLFPLVLTWHAAIRLASYLDTGDVADAEITVLHDILLVTGIAWLASQPYALVGAIDGPARLLLLTTLAWHIVSFVHRTVTSHSDAMETAFIGAVSLTLTLSFALRSPTWIPVAIAFAARIPMTGFEPRLTRRIGIGATPVTALLNLAQVGLLTATRAITIPALVIQAAVVAPWVGPTPLDAILLTVTGVLTALMAVPPAAARATPIAQDFRASQRRASFFG